MKIILADYKEGIPVSVRETYDPKKLDLEFVDLKYLKPLDMNGIVEKSNDTVNFQGTLKSRIEKMCARCLRAIPSDVEKDFAFYYETTGKEVIDTIDDLRETLILDHSISFLCTDSCKGLCPHCGGNRNEKDCSCESDVKNNVFAELKKLLKKKSK